METEVARFVGVAALLTITPGADMAMVTKVARAAGRRAALFATLGIGLGILVWAAASAAGLAAVLTASAAAYAAVKLVGAAYLVALGIGALWRARRRPAAGAPDGPEAPPAPAATGPAFRQGLLSNLLNPKIGVFYAVLLPQFVSPEGPVLATSLLLAGLHVVMGLVWLSGYAYLVTRAGDVLRRPPVRRALERVTGAVLVGLGLRLAVAE